MRRAATGRLAELGLGTIEGDIATRTLWYSEDELQKIYDDWDPAADIKPMIEAYVDGINACIEGLEQTTRMPVEYMHKSGPTSSLSR